jgi:hypothetical protein
VTVSRGKVFQKKAPPPVYANPPVQFVFREYGRAAGRWRRRRNAERLCEGPSIEHDAQCIEQPCDRRPACAL